MKSCSTEEKLAGYYKQIKRNLAASGEDQKAIMNHLERNVRDYIDENPDCQFEDVVNHFGTAEAFAAEYLSGMEDQEMIRRIRKSKWIKLTIIFAAIAAVAVIAVGTVAITLENSRSAIYYRKNGIVDKGIATE